MKQRTQRIFAAFLSIVLTLSLCPWVLAEYPAETRTGVEGDYAGKTVILHSNDVHGEIMGYAYIAALKTEFQNKGADVILADAGDFSQGDPTVSLSKGADAVAMMNAAGYDVATLGNHEFDFGYEQLVTNLKAANFRVICADVFEGDNTILPPTWTYEKGNLKIGFFGMETPESQTKVNPGLIQGIRFLAKDDIYACAQTQIDALRGDGADIVIALAHLGVDAESAPDGHRSVDMYAHTTGVDLILDGHSHTVMTAGENGEPVQSTGTKFANIGVVVIDNASEKIEARYLIPTKITETVEEDGKEVEKVISELPKDETVTAAAQDIIDRVNAEYGQVFATTATYEDVESTVSQVEARFRFSPSITGGQADAPAAFDPSWFFQSARANYQSGLARLSIRAAMAAFGTNAVLESDSASEPVRYLSEEATYSTSANIVRLMRDLGFSKITADYQNPGLDTIGYAIANKEISDEAGQSARLILIAVRGGGYRQEWASNFTIGLSKEHQGFSGAASMVFQTAQTYLSELRADGYGGAVKFWITGYSRGAAVANLTAQRLTALADSDSGFTRDDVFAYCFACPRNVIPDSSDTSAYDNIANIVHYADFVPKIPVSPWGYGRYGKTYYLPSPELTARYPDALEKMSQSLSAFFSAIQPEQGAAVTQQSVQLLTHLLNNQGMLTDRFTDTMAVHVGSQSAFVDMVQGAFRDAIAATGGADGFGTFFQVLTGLPDYYERYEQDILPIVNNGTLISLAHAPELYLAWLDALERADAYSPDGRLRVLAVDGSADVAVFDGSGATAAQMTDSGAADAVLPAYVNPDGQKIVLLPPDGAFRVELTASGSGTVSYQIEETDLETGVTNRLTGYYEIPVNAGDRLTGTVEALAAGVRGEYPLRDAGGTTLTPAADVREAVRNCKVSVSIQDSGSGERNGYARGGGLYVPGEYAQTLATPADNAVFLGWYENGTLISNDAQFRFRVTGDRTLTAVFSTEKPAYQVSVEGGSGSGTYQQGDSVSITANDAPDGQIFDRWLGADGLNFISGNQNSASAAFAMPGNDVTLTAAFRAQSDQSNQNTQGGCYVATAVYGSYDCPEVWTLRRFRDNVLAETWYGRLFIRLYYAVSPTAVKLFGECEWFRGFFRDKLDALVSGLQEDGFESTPYQDRAW